MSQRYINLIIILVLLAGVIWIDLPSNPGIKIGEFERDLKTVLGLDLQGGMQVLLEADVPANEEVTQQQLADARQIIENRSNALGVSESLFQVTGNRRISGEFPGLTNTEEVVAAIKETGRLAFVDFGSQYIEEGTVVKTDVATGSASGTEEAPASEPTEETDATPAETTEATPAVEETVYHAVMTGDQLAEVSVATTELGEVYIAFRLKEDGAQAFSEYTSNNMGNFLGIVLDGVVISSPQVENAITTGEGIIRGNFTYESANALAIQLRYGSLPVPLKVVETRLIGPTLGQDSLTKSLRAGIIGFILVVLFMTIYYRLPGGVAILSILSYGAITFAIYKLLPVTLTLPGIAGFLLSTGGALDANILMFERLKEELRAGRTLRQAVDISWRRAWPSIRDSNIATLITSVILFWFGSAYGATIVKGFALTLALGVGVSLFSAAMITRTYLAVALDIIKPTNLQKWFGA